MLCGVCIIIYALNIVQLALYRIDALSIMMQTVLTNILLHRSRYWSPGKCHQQQKQNQTL